MKISLIIPCYNEEESIDLLYKEICLVLEELKRFDIEIIFVDDGSKDNTLDRILKISEEDNKVKYVSFSRNFGKEAAVYAGFYSASGDYIGLLDADLQHPPKALIPMIEALEFDDYDIAAARRINRKGEKKGYSFCAKSFYKLINRTFQVKIEDGAQDFRVMKRKVVEAILNMPEYHRFSKGIFSWVGFKTKWFEHENVERVNGTTKWSFRKSCGYAIDGIVSFSTMPLRIALCIGTIASLLGFLYVSYIILRTLIYGADIPGFPTLVSFILIMNGFILLSLGIVGEYIAKIFTEIKHRPLYIIDKTNVEVGEIKSK
ncbi:glycosyltransferase [Alkalibaculum sp. M08DMB]|uniref:Glycosyltransferase n=1 Tax=Alkalibaculum sporogenes TaxID=2655001 RepID=A0A6A7KBU2_9FIRM|nr:glycosyltransferase family 2 protein [Alkalibaculum sporogenes]MPW26751.1 glycosyltransferase [Alkalibaculum sporogenes]